MRDATRTISPLKNKKFERIVQKAADDLLSKPGFIYNPSTRDYAVRAMRAVVLDSGVIELAEAVNKLFLSPDTDEEEKK